MILNISELESSWDDLSSSGGSASSSILFVELPGSLRPPYEAPPPPPPSPYEVPPLSLWGVLLCASGTLIVAENAVVLTTILATPSLRAPVFLLLASLGAADLLAGVALLLHFLFLFCVEPSDWSELITSGLLVTSLTASICSLMGVALDRYLSLSHALTYGSGQSRRRALALLALTWAAAGALGAGPALGWHCLGDAPSCSVARPLTRTYLSLLCGGFLVVVAVTLQLYAGICRVARRHAHAIATQRHFLPAKPPSSSSTSYGGKHGHGHGHRHGRHHHPAPGRGFSRLVVVLGVFVGCWTPFSLWGLLGDASSPPLYTYATLVLPAAGSSLLNPLLYSLRNKDIRKVLLTACCPHRCVRDSLNNMHRPVDV